MSTRARLSGAARQARERIGQLIYERGDFADTSEWVDLHSGDAERVRYEPSRWSLLPRALRGEGIGPQHVFIDYGAGKGRVLHQAARYPFGRVMGVEVSEELSAVARGNLERNRDRFKCRSFEVLTTDVMNFEPPDDVTHAYFWNPFQGAPFHAAIEGLVRSYDRNPRPLRLIYVNPMEAPYLAGTGRVRHVSTSVGLRRRLLNRVTDEPFEDPTKIAFYDVIPG